MRVGFRCQPRQSLIDGVWEHIILLSVNTTVQTDTVRFTTRGQVVIPPRFRKLCHIEDGTRAIGGPARTDWLRRHE